MPLSQMIGHYFFLAFLDEQAASYNGDVRAVVSEKIKILIVEDEKDSAAEMAELFEIWGFSVQTAYDGVSAVQLALSFRPNVILLDIGLPNQNGFVVSRVLRDKPAFQQTLIIAISAFGSEVYQRTGQISGMDHYFVKPANFDLVRKLIDVRFPQKILH